MSGGQNDYQGQSKYSVYRQIRQQRTYRTLGRMTRWRVILGFVLLLSVFFISGAVSKSFAARGHFRTAKALMLSPRWVETYNPDLGRYIDAGLLYEDGDYAGALAGFEALGDSKAARQMAGLSALRLAEERRAAGDEEGAREALSAVDPTLLPETETAAYEALSSVLGAQMS